MFDPDGFNWLYHQQLIRGDLSGFFDLSERVSQKSVYCEFTSGVIKRHNGKISESLADFRSILKQNGNSNNKIETLQAASRSLFLLGRYKAATEALQQAQKVRGREKAGWKHHYYLGQNYKSAGREEQALREFQISVEIEANAQSLYELAEIAISTGNRSEGIEQLRRGLDVFPDSPKLNLKLGQILADLIIDTNNQLKDADSSTAIACLKLSCESDSLGSLVLGGILQNSNSDLSVSHYRKYYHDNPASSILWNNLGILCFQKGKKLAAISCLRRSVYLDPLAWKSWLNLSLIYLQNGQLIAALNALNTVLSLHRNSFIFSTFGLTLQLLGQFENAAKAYSKARKVENVISANEQSVIGLYNKAVFYAKSNKEKCVSILKKDLFEVLKSKDLILDPELRNRIQQIYNFMQLSPPTD